MTIDGGMIYPRSIDGEAALAATLDWLRTPGLTNEFGDFARQPLDASGEPDTLAEHLSMAGLKDWRDAIVAAASPEQPIRLNPRISWLMGQAAIEVAVSSNQCSLFGVIERLQMLGGLNHAALASAVCSRISNASDDFSLLTCLRTCLQRTWNSHFNDRLRHYAEATNTRPLTSRDIWPNYRGMLIGNGWAHQVAATLWPDRYMEMLANFPAPFQLGVGDPLSPIDLDLVASLVRASPAVFSSDGVPLGPVVVFVLLDVIETQFTTINAQDVETAKLGLVSVLDSVFARSDGDWIARAWLQQIIWRDTRRRAGREQADVAAQRALRDMLLVHLSARIRPLSDAVFAWVRQEEPLWRVNRVLSEASILDSHGNATVAANILAEAIQQGLVSATGRPDGLTTGSPEAIFFACALTQHPNMMQWFETLWRNTYELREHMSYQAHRDLDNPAYPALSWGLNGLNSSQETSIDRVGFWRVIAAAVFETQRIDPNAGLFNGPMPPLTRLMAQLGAILVERDILPIQDFANFMADQIEPTAEYAHLWQIVRSKASDAVALEAGRLVGAALVRQALEAGLSQLHSAWEATLNQAVKDDLADFLNRL